MSTMTFRAPDSVTALELVQRRLGPDALILSNVLIDGQVVITASDDAPESHERPASRPRLRPLSVDLLVDGPIAPPEPESVPGHAPVAAPPSALVATRLPSFLAPDARKPFDRMLGEAKATAPVIPIKAHDTPPILPDPLILRDRLLAAPRIVLVGPVGAGKSQAALQLALMRLARNPETTVQFCFCGTGSHSDGAFLAQKSHLLGMETLFITPDHLATPQSGNVQIVVISGRGNDGPSLGRAALEIAEARAALVMSDGLRADRIGLLKTQWTGLTEAVILSGPQEAGVDANEKAALNGAGLVPLWTSSSDRLVEGLRVIEEETATRRTRSSDAIADPSSPLVFRRHSTEPEART